MAEILSDCSHQSESKVKTIFSINLDRKLCKKKLRGLRVLKVYCIFKSNQRKYCYLIKMRGFLCTPSMWNISELTFYENGGGFVFLCVYLVGTVFLTAVSSRDFTNVNS